MIITKFQIINGAQTVGSLAGATPKDSVMVLFRLVETGHVDTESGINQKIIESNNTQNAIRDSDFRANDSIQKYLESEISRLGITSLFGKRLHYQRKRSSRASRGQTRCIRLEELAKIRYAYLNSPCVVYGSPKLLWTAKKDADGRGLYEVAFGSQGVLGNEWKKQELHQALVAVEFPDRSVSSARQEIERAASGGAGSEHYGILHRMRFHVVALVGQYMRLAPDIPPDHTFLDHRDRCDVLWPKMWKIARNVIVRKYREHVLRDRDPLTLSAFMRNEDLWQRMVEDLRLEV